MRRKKKKEPEIDPNPFIPGKTWIGTVGDLKKHPEKLRAMNEYTLFKHHGITLEELEEKLREENEP